MYQLVNAIPGVLCILGFLPLVLIEPTTAGRRLDPVAPEQTAKVVVGDSRFARIDSDAASVTANGRMAFAFGFLEFDWDPGRAGRRAGVQFLAEARPERGRDKPAQLVPPPANVRGKNDGNAARWLGIRCHHFRAVRCRHCGPRRAETPGVGCAEPNASR